jgi:hypothetical protein
MADLTIVIDGQEQATILAALRFYQEQGMGDPANRSDAIHDIATDGEAQISMDATGIDRLCGKVNGWPLPADPEEPPLFQCASCSRAFLLEELTPAGSKAAQGEAAKLDISGECPKCSGPCHAIDMEEAGALLVSACEAQHAYWDALRDLEGELGVDIDDIGDMEGLTVKDVIDSFGPDGFGGTEDNEEG